MNMRRTLPWTLLFGLLALALSPSTAGAGQPCDLAPPYITIGDTAGDVFINAGQTVLIQNATITGSVLGTTGAEGTHVSVINSRIKGSIIFKPANGDGDGSICVRGDDAGTVISGGVDLEKSRDESKIEIHNNVEVFGAVSLDKSNEVPPPACGGVLTIQGNVNLRPALHSDAAATGACEASVQYATLKGDFQADGTTGDVTVTNNAISGDFQADDTTGNVRFKNNTSSGDFEVQNSAGDVFIENVTSTSDISVDGAKKVQWKNDLGTGGDAGFSNIHTLIVDNVGNAFPVNGLISIGPVDTAMITNSRFKGGLEADLVRNLTVTGNTFPEGGLKVEGDIVNGEYVSENVVIEKNTIGSGSLEVTKVENVTVTGNTVNNGNLTIKEFDQCVAGDNNVPKGNNETAGCR